LGVSAFVAFVSSFATPDSGLGNCPTVCAGNVFFGFFGVV